MLLSSDIRHGRHCVSALHVHFGLKGVSSRLLRIERLDLEKRYWKNVLWSSSYLAASCGGAPLGIIKQ
jgi:REP element-mobilizing transposase RayT